MTPNAARTDIGRFPDLIVLFGDADKERLSGSLFGTLTGVTSIVGRIEVMISRGLAAASIFAYAISLFNFAFEIPGFIASARSYASIAS
jgi:hypothetical protein